MRMGDFAVDIRDERGNPVSVSIHEDYTVLYTTMRITKAHHAGGSWIPVMGTLTYTVADPQTEDPLTPLPD